MKRYYLIILALWFVASCLNGYMDYLDFYRNIPCNLQQGLWIFKDSWHTVKFGTLLCITGITLLAMFPPRKTELHGCELNFGIRFIAKYRWEQILLALAILAVLNYTGHELFMKWVW